jgi:hypothetical protein
MSNLSAEFSAFVQLLDAHLCRTIPSLPVGTGRCRQPEPVMAAFNYCLALAMVEAGKARLVER